MIVGDSFIAFLFVSSALKLLHAPCILFMSRIPHGPQRSHVNKPWSAGLWMRVDIGDAYWCFVYERRLAAQVNQGTFLGRGTHHVPRHNGNSDLRRICCEGLQSCHQANEHLRQAASEPPPRGLQ
jgi:hypothetical protein